MYIYIYIYIYIYTDCFVLPQLFSVARHTRCCKLRLKPDLLYISQISYSWAFVILIVSEGIFWYIFTYTISATIVLNSLEEFCIYVYVAASKSLECSTPWGRYMENNTMIIKTVKANLKYWPSLLLLRCSKSTDSLETLSVFFSKLIPGDSTKFL